MAPWLAAAMPPRHLLPLANLTRCSAAWVSQTERASRASKAVHLTGQIFKVCAVRVNVIRPALAGGASDGGALDAEGAPRLKLAGVDRDAPRVIGGWCSACMEDYVTMFSGIPEEEAHGRAKQPGSCVPRQGVGPAGALRRLLPCSAIRLQVRCLSFPTLWMAGSSAWWRCR